MSIGDTFLNMASDHNAPLVVYIAHTANYADMMDFRTKAYLLSHKEFSSLTKSGVDWNKHLSPGRLIESLKILIRLMVRLITIYTFLKDFISNSCIVDL